jgi:hypothetical protein
MDKHGSEDWLGPLMDELGPSIQVQVTDFTSLLEAAYNFYHFRSPPATIASLTLFGALFLHNAFLGFQIRPQGILVCRWYYLHRLASQFPTSTISTPRLTIRMDALGGPHACRMVFPIPERTSYTR